MSDSGPIYVVDPRNREGGRDAVNLFVEYRDAEDLVRDCEAILSAATTVVQTQRDFAVGSQVTLVLSFPGLVRPLRLVGAVEGTGDPAERGVRIGFRGLDMTTRAAIGEHIQQIKAQNPDYVVRAICVLVVEDNPHCAKLIQEGLRLAGKRAFGNRVAFDVPMASNAADALTFLHSRPIDVLITDIYLGGVSGTTVIEHVRADAVLQRIPIIAISAGDEATRNVALQAGADVFLPKPVRLRQIVGTVGEVLNLEQVAWR